MQLLRRTRALCLYEEQFGRSVCYQHYSLEIVGLAVYFCHLYVGKEMFSAGKSRKRGKMSPGQGNLKKKSME